MGDSSPNPRFVSTASLWPPRLVSEQSAWNEHIPFAGWIVEATRPGVLVELGAHTGVSYFAFCESVLRLDLATSCYAVDNWVGDEHAGYYGQEVFRAVKEMNSKYYESFSRLLRADFDEAVESFEESSIDLLHIDGLHTYEAVRHDFETWLPKLSKRGVVLMHDTNERKEGFGVHAFFKELSRSYKTFEFTHEHGLAIVCVGSEQPQQVLDLVALDTAAEGRQVRGIYEALGRRISADLSVALQAQRLAERDQELERKAGELDRRDRSIDHLTEEIAGRDRAIREGRAAAEQLRTELKATAAELKATAAELDTQLAQTELQTQRLTAIESSTSWRLTAPARYVVDRLKALFRRRQRPSPEPDVEVRRIYDTFDAGQDLTARRRLHAHYQQNPSLSQTLASIIMPTHNRAGQVTDAIESVLDQAHQNWELIIVDDGSEDDTPNVVGQYTGDPRVRYVQVPWGGVSRARNTGLDLVTGSVIAFLDSDNQWDPSFLELMIAALDSTDADIAYSGMRLLHNGSVAGYRGHEFDYEECLRGNYIDLNVLCHKRSITEDGARFDETMRRMVDWDYLLDIARNRTVHYEPFVGANYMFHSSPDQISEREVRLYGALVEAKHSRQLTSGQVLDSQSAFRQIPLNIAICIAAPRSDRSQWGDYHYAVGLSQAFERKGHAVAVVYHDEEISGVPDVMISLRGLTHHEPSPGSVSVLWSISHPDLLSWEEIESFDLMFSASLTWPEAIRWSGSRPIHVLPQATDRARFFPAPTGVDHSPDLLFVGNSRGADRPMVTQAIEAGLPLSVYGQGWEGRIPGEYVKGKYIPNEELSDWYATSGAVLNDHWDSMREYGYISNRIFDVVAAGGRTISDHLPSIRRVFGDSVTTVSTGGELADRFKELSAEDHDRHEPAIWVLRNHSLDSRVESLLAHVEDFVVGAGGYTPVEIGGSGCRLCAIVPISGSSASEGAESRLPVPGTGVHVRGDTRLLRVAMVPQPAGKAVTSSAYIRLVQPLTSEVNDFAIDLVRVRPDDPDASPVDLLDEVDALVVSRTAFGDLSTAQRWVDASRQRGIPMILDTDDAFHLMDETHPEFHMYLDRLEAYALIVDRAAEVWCSTPALAKSLSRQGSNAIVVPNSIDPRLWRQYRQAPMAPVRDGSPTLEMLYAGTATHGPDLAEVLPVLDELADEFDFRLTIVGIDEEAPSRPWLFKMSPGSNTLYPRYARWIREGGSRFDVAIAPLVDNEFNRLKSDIKLLEYLAIGAIPLVSNLDPYSESDLALPPMLCDSPEQWLERLRELSGDHAAVGESRALAHQQRDAMWRSRNAATTGTYIANRLADVVDRVK